MYICIYTHSSCASLQLIPCPPPYLQVCEHNMLSQTSVDPNSAFPALTTSAGPRHFHVFLIEPKSHTLNVAFREFSGNIIHSFFCISIAPFTYVHFTNLWLFISISVSPLRPWGQTCKSLRIPPGSTGCFHMTMLAQCPVKTGRNTTPSRNPRKPTLR